RRAERDFRDDANRVLRMVHERMQRENREFYPRIEAL
ncbi:MAG TPA: hemerythrin, partial [Comamonadaceae bacterium]|nr:hemerythrin [Comamonadaceae bacterium]